MDKRKMLTLLGEKVEECKKCPDLAENRIRTVLHSGNPYGKVTLVAEAPGENEVKQGEVLVGRSGKLLNNIMTTVGWTRENDVYLCNILRCRPPNNRKPTDEECLNCEPFLELQLDIVNPKFIVCLGTVAAQNLLKTRSTISSLRGKVHQYKDAKVICSFHPSYALRNPDAKMDIYEDLMKMEKLITSEKTGVS